MKSSQLILPVITLVLFQQLISCKKNVSVNTPSGPTIPAVLTATTIAGNGAAGSADGTGTAATFNGPNGVAVDAQGNVYCGADNKIYKISPAGVF